MTRSPSHMTTISPAFLDWLAQQTAVVSHTILIIEDEPLMRKIVADILRDVGFDVVTAASGEVGLAQYYEKVASIKLVLLDYTMPGINGEEAYHKLRKVNPDLKIILSSSYMDTATVRRFQRESNVDILPKPYSLGALLQKITQLVYY